MRYDQIDIALSFLEPGELICLQVPYARDIRLVVHYLEEKLGNEITLIKNCGQEVKLTGNRTIHIRPISNDFCGYGYMPGQLFFIERDHDRSYMRELEVN